MYFHSAVVVQHCHMCVGIVCVSASHNSHVTQLTAIVLFILGVQTNISILENVINKKKPSQCIP